jgi:short chain dehydrogenase
MEDKFNPAQLRLQQIAGHVVQPKISDYPVPHYSPTTSNTRLRGKVAIITGCNSERGIGRASAIVFAASGAKAVVMADLDSANLAKWAQQIRQRYPSTAVEWRQFDASGIRSFDPNPR